MWLAGHNSKLISGYHPSRLLVQCQYLLLLSQRHFLFIGSSTSGALQDTITAASAARLSTRTMTGHLMFVEFTSDGTHTPTDLRFRINVVAVGDYCKCCSNRQNMWVHVHVHHT